MDFEQFSTESFEMFQEAGNAGGKTCCSACARAAELEAEAEGNDTTSASGPQLAAGTRVLLVGDSHTHGAFGQELERLLVAQQVNVLRRAKIGSAPKYWWPRLPALLQQHQPEVVIVALGANMRGYPSARGTALHVRKTVQLIVRALPKARIIWIGPPRQRADGDADLARFNAIIKKGLGTQVRFIDSAALTPRYVGRDGVHYATAPGKAWARGAFAALKGALEKELEDESFEDEALGAYENESFEGATFENEALGAYEDESFELFDEAASAPSDVQAFVERLGDEWSRRRGGTPAPDAMKQWLLQDYADTLTGARQRWKKLYGKGRFSVANLSRAWMVSREATMKFQGGFPGVKALAGFAPPAAPVQLVSSPLVEESNLAPVAPLTVQFAKELKQRYPGVRASNYRGHGGGSFNDRGFSLDLFLKGLDARGFYQPTEAIRLLHAVHDAAVAVGAEWRVIYNDYDVANAVNRGLGRQHVIFMGTTRKSGKRVSGLNWHGPDPLILHFHLDLSPVNGPSRSRWRAAGSAGMSQEAEAGKSPKIDSKLVARIDRYSGILESEAKQAGVSPHVLRGIIAAESDGDPNAGKGGGYKGLMQCETDEGQLTPAVSIRCGAKKYRDFTQSMRKFLAKLKQSFDSLPEDERIRIVMASYNAGPGTVKLAMQFAATAGDFRRWLEPEHYLRALLATGAYSTGPGPLKWCLAGQRITVDDMAADLSRISGKSLDELRPRYAARGAWDKKLLLERLPLWLRIENKKLRTKSPPALAELRARASKSLLCAATFKQSHTGSYIDKVLRYKRYFATV
jgi:hypothetical protein